MYDLTIGAVAVLTECLIGLTKAVKAAAHTKNTSNPMKIHDMPLIRRFLFAGADVAAAAMPSVLVS